MSKWERVKLGEVCEIVSGTTPKTKVERYWGGGISWITPAELDKHTMHIFSSERTITQEAVNESNLKKLPVGTILLSSRAPIGKVAIAGTELYSNQGFKNFICKGKIHNEYLYWFLLKSHDYLNFLGRGATFKEISAKIVKEIEIPLPPLPIQKQIASVLDTATGLVEHHQTMLEELDALAQSVFYQMFGDPVTNEKGWKVDRLSKVLRIIGGYAFKSAGFKSFGIPVIKIGNINTGVFNDDRIDFWEEEDALGRYLLKPGDIVISLTGTVGKDDYGNVCILPADYSYYYLNQRNAKLDIFGQLDSFYLLYLMKHCGIKEKLTCLSRGVRQANISNGDLSNLVIPLPPLPLQQEFASIIEKIEAEKKQVQQGLTESKALLDSLMNQYFGN